MREQAFVVATQQHEVHGALPVRAPKEGQPPFGDEHELAMTASGAIIDSVDEWPPPSAPVSADHENGPAKLAPPALPPASPLPRPLGCPLGPSCLA
eukprot:CAMPEP_0171612682 /NCGR_PEP_ID=MMETSP0990-20121206/11341_1 /TAXON_ID=483369 /ORGANISM="non described non described, Strain CCMP2098" /LENGTH=95 /DNA_ID=CAMNT_0012176431 /DNA_START=41 /DNA_END=326 /DNA_ORIENTATION=+